MSNYYKVCPWCGAHLDPGEKCDCEQKKEGLPDANQYSPCRTEDNSLSDEIISRPIDKVNPLHDLRISRGLAVPDMVETVKALYPKFDRHLQSKCEHGDTYGIDLKSRAFDALLAKFAPDLLVKVRHERDGRHSMKRRIGCRLSEEDYAALVKKIREDGYQTMQEWLTYMVRAYLVQLKSEK